MSKVPNYLNSSLRIKSALLSLCILTASDILSYDNMSNDEKKYLKYISTYGRKWLDSLCARLDLSEQKRLMNVLIDNKPTLVPKNSKKRKLPVSDDTIHDMLEVFIDTFCRGCDVDDKECVKCRMFQINQDLNIKLIGDRPEGLCPYYYKGEN